MNRAIHRNLVVAGLLTILLAAGCESKPPTSPAAGASVPIARQPSPAEKPGSPAEKPDPTPKPADGPWTMDVKKLSPPDTPVAGKLGGQEFKPDNVKFEHDQISLRQGKEFFADKEVKVWLTGDHDTLEGLKLEIKPDVEFGLGVPHINMGVKKPGDDFAKTESFMNKYAMKLELGKIEGGKLTGKIHLCLPDKDRSYVAGSFTIDAKELGTSKISGKVGLPTGTKDIKLNVGFVGQDLTGKPRSGFVGFKVTPGEDSFVGSFASRLDSKKDGVTFRHGRVLPGTYLVFLGWDQGALAWKWLEVKERSDIKLDLAVEQSGTGKLEVSLPAGEKETRVTLLPLDADGKLPTGAGNPTILAMQLSNYIKEMGADAKGDAVTFARLRPGHYRVIAGKASADAEVKAGATAKATLK